MKCDNKDGKILSPGCGNAEATHNLIITYSESAFGADTDSLKLCGKCASKIKKDAERHAYRTLLTRKR